MQYGQLAGGSVFCPQRYRRPKGKHLFIAEVNQGRWDGRKIGDVMDARAWDALNVGFESAHH